MNELSVSAVSAETLDAPARSRQRADDEFQALFVATFPSVARTVHLLVGDRAVAEEIAQDAFIQLLGSWRKVSRYERPDLWVRRVAIRKAQRERHRIWQRDGLERSAAGAVRLADEPGDDTQVRAAVDTLPPKQRAVVVLFYFEDRPMDEIATLLDCSASAGWTQLHTARKKLAVLLSEEVDDDVR